MVMKDGISSEMVSFLQILSKVSDKSKYLAIDMQYFLDFKESKACRPTAYYSH